MFKELLGLWGHEKTLLEETIDSFETMLGQAEKIYKDVTDALFLGGNLAQLKEQVKNEDFEINKLEQEIRRKVVTHLSVGVEAQANINSALILMSVVKDVERIGDYAKNIFEVFEKTSKLEPGPYHDRLLDIRNVILQSFKDVNRAFREGNTESAKKALKVISEYKDKCDGIVEEFLDKTTEHAVAYALLSRFFKRTLGHLGNIVTSVIMPIDKLDYFDEQHV